MIFTEIRPYWIKSGALVLGSHGEEHQEGYRAYLYGASIGMVCDDCSCRFAAPYADTQVVPLETSTFSVHLATERKCPECGSKRVRTRTKENLLYKALVSDNNIPESIYLKRHMAEAPSKEFIVCDRDNRISGQRHIYPANASVIRQAYFDAHMLGTHLTYRGFYGLTHHPILTDTSPYNGHRLKQILLGARLSGLCVCCTSNMIQDMRDEPLPDAGEGAQSAVENFVNAYYGDDLGETLQKTIFRRIMGGLDTNNPGIVRDMPTVLAHFRMDAHPHAPEHRLNGISNGAYTTRILGELPFGKRVAVEDAMEHKNAAVYRYLMGAAYAMARARQGNGTAAGILVLTSLAQALVQPNSPALPRGAENRMDMLGYPWMTPEAQYVCSKTSRGGWLNPEYFHATEMEYDPFLLSDKGPLESLENLYRVAHNMEVSPESIRDIYLAICASYEAYKGGGARTSCVIAGFGELLTSVNQNAFTRSEYEIFPMTVTSVKDYATTMGIPHHEILAVPTDDLDDPDEDNQGENEENEENEEDEGVHEEGLTIGDIPGAAPAERITVPGARNPEEAAQLFLANLMHQRQQAFRQANAAQGGAATPPV